MNVPPLDLSRLKIFPLSERKNLTRADDILIDPDAPAKTCSDPSAALIRQCARDIHAARKRDAAVMLIYGAHLLRNGAARILERMMARGWITHLATNGAGTIHDWEYAWFGASTESVEMNVASGTFGTWHETATNIHLAILAGALDGLGYGRALGRFISEDGATLPAMAQLAADIAREPAHSLASARADLLRAMREQSWPEGRVVVEHRWKHASILCQAFRHGVPLTVHPGIGYDIISNHPVFNGAAIGRAGEWDFKLFGGSVARLEGESSSRSARPSWDRRCSRRPSVASTTCGCKMAKASWAAIRSSWSTFRTAAAGTGGRENPQKRTRPITCGFAKAILGWGEPCAMCNATMSPSSTICITPFWPRGNSRP